MKKIMIAAAAAAAAYFYLGQSGSNVGVYTDDGTPQTILFTTEKCGRACDEMRGYLKSRMAFDEVDAFDNGNGHELYEGYGGSGHLPYIVMGKQRITGPDRGAVISSIAAEFGLEEVREKERKALQRHFDASGDARVVMYATDWCG